MSTVLKSAFRHLLPHMRVFSCGVSGTLGAMNTTGTRPSNDSTPSLSAERIRELAEAPREYTTTDMADLFGISPHTVRARVTANALPAPVQKQPHMTWNPKAVWTWVQVKSKTTTLGFVPVQFWTHQHSTPSTTRTPSRHVDTTYTHPNGLLILRQFDFSDHAGRRPHDIALGATVAVLGSQLTREQGYHVRVYPAVDKHPFFMYETTSAALSDSIGAPLPYFPYGTKSPLGQHDIDSSRTAMFVRPARRAIARMPKLPEAVVNVLTAVSEWIAQEDVIDCLKDAQHAMGQGHFAIYLPPALALSNHAATQPYWTPEPAAESHSPESLDEIIASERLVSLVRAAQEHQDAVEHISSVDWDEILRVPVHRARASLDLARDLASLLVNYTSNFALSMDPAEGTKEALFLSRLAATGDDEETLAHVMLSAKGPTGYDGLRDTDTLDWRIDPLVPGVAAVFHLATERDGSRTVSVLPATMAQLLAHLRTTTSDLGTLTISIENPAAPMICDGHGAWHPMPTAKSSGYSAGYRGTGPRALAGMLAELARRALDKDTTPPAVADPFVVDSLLELDGYPTEFTVAQAARMF